MKKHLAFLLSAVMVISFAACSNGKQSSETTTTAQASEKETVASTTADETTQLSVVDFSSLKWVKGELDCYGYDYKGKPYYLSYSYPETFKTATEADSGLQYFGYYFNPSDSEAKPNNSPYGLYIYFGQGSSGGMTKASFEEDVQGGVTERELGGRTVLFGELSPDPNTGAHVFGYYLSYEEDGWSRIWILVTDPEADGTFRKTFEESMSFEK